jgi:hypothetical protein
MKIHKKEVFQVLIFIVGFYIINAGIYFRISQLQSSIIESKSIVLESNSIESDIRMAEMNGDKNRVKELVSFGQSKSIEGEIEFLNILFGY